MTSSSDLSPLAKKLYPPTSSISQQLPIILLSNALSLREKAHHLVQLLEDDMPHIAIITKTWLKPETSVFTYAHVCRNSTSYEKPMPTPTFAETQQATRSNTT